MTIRVLTIRVLKWLGIFSLAAIFFGVLYWWAGLPYHDLPVEYELSPSSSLNGNIPRPSIRDLAYSNKSRFHKLDLYLPAGEGPFPLVIWIHGGGLILGDKSSMPQTDFGPAPTPTGPYGPYQVQVPDVVQLNSSGYAVASLNYRLGASPVTAAKSAIKDSKAAVRFLRKNSGKYNIDPNRFAVWGNSMGGYLAAMLGVTGNRATPFDDPELIDVDVSSAVQAVIVWYGAEDRMPGRQLNLGYQISQSRDLPPFLIVNGDRDPVINVEQATKLHEALEKAGATSQLVILPGAGHEDPLFGKTQMPPSLEFLRQALK